jgi:hypothetical protein
VRVGDKGTGIPPQIKDKLFQPFFTTKPTSGGTGLGLSISYDIFTQQYGGTITVESEPGSFRVYRPPAAPVGEGMSVSILSTTSPMSPNTSRRVAGNAKSRGENREIFSYGPSRGILPPPVYGTGSE